MKIRSTIAGIAAFAAALPAFAQVKLNDAVTVTGWATGSYQYTAPSPGTSFDSFNLDAGELEAIITPTKNTTATVSLYYRPSSEGGVTPSGGELTLLDANIAYTNTSGVTITAGKFLSYLGYESFYFDQDNMISLANQQFLAPIPGYHEGVKLDYSPTKTDTFGFALVDSLNSKPGYAATEGDGELKHNAGGEAYFTDTSIANLTLWFGVGYDTKGNFEPHSDTVLDFWASYTVNKMSSFAVEEIYKDGGDFITGTGSGSNWLLYYNFTANDKWNCWFCFSGEDVSSSTASDGEGGFVTIDGPKYVKYSISPTYTVNANLQLRAQYSYTKYNDYVLNDANFIGAEAIFKF
jgi:hypothetical protein